MEKMNIVLFDMDNTLVLADTVKLWAHFLDQKGIMSDEDWQKRYKFDEDYIEHRLDIAASFDFELALLKRIPLSKREQWRYEFFEEMVKPCISKAGLQLIQEYKTQPNTIVILITATHTFLASPVAQHAEVHEMIATEEEIHEGEYTGRVSGMPNMGEGKLKKFRDWVEKNQISPVYTVLYSDSINDLPLLSEVNKPIVVDPDHRLKAVALQRNWDIISLKVADESGEKIPAITFTLYDGYMLNA